MGLASIENNLFSNQSWVPQIIEWPFYILENTEEGAFGSWYIPYLNDSSILSEAR